MLERRLLNVNGSFFRFYGISPPPFIVVLDSSTKDLYCENHANSEFMNIYFFRSWVAFDGLILPPLAFILLEIKSWNILKFSVKLRRFLLEVEAARCIREVVVDSNLYRVFSTNVRTWRGSSACLDVRVSSAETLLQSAEKLLQYVEKLLQSRFLSLMLSLQTQQSSNLCLP